MGVASEYRGPLTFKWLVVQDAKDSWNSGGQRQYPQDKSLFPSNTMREIDGRIACFQKKSAIRTAPRYCAFAIWNWESLQTHTPIWITSIELCPFPSKATVMSGQYLHYTHTHTHRRTCTHTRTQPAISSHMSMYKLYKPRVSLGSSNDVDVWVFVPNPYNAILSVGTPRTPCTSEDNKLTQKVFKVTFGRFLKAIQIEFFAPKRKFWVTVGVKGSRFESLCR